MTPPLKVVAVIVVLAVLFVALWCAHHDHAGS